MAELEGTVALVTGAGSGIGEATAEALAQHGAKVARRGSGVYNLTKHGVGAFSESLRQEFADRHLRVSLVEPGAVATALTDHLRPEVRESSRDRFKDVERLDSEDIAYIVTARAPSRSTT